VRKTDHPLKSIGPAAAISFCAGAAAVLSPGVLKRALYLVWVLCVK
jgi:hypothetical protein